MNSVIQPLQSLREPGDIQEFHFPLSISKLYPESGEFAHYEGSLTTPTCNEQVAWSIFLQPQPISEAQVRYVSLFTGLIDINPYIQIKTWLARVNSFI